MTSKLQTTNLSALTLIVVGANLGMFLFGYELGAGAWLVNSINELAAAGDGYYYTLLTDNTLLLGFVLACVPLGALICYPILLIYFNHVSKKMEILQAAVFFFTGALLSSISGQLDWEYSTGFVLLLVGRLLYGGGIASTLHSVPQYIVETVPAAVRGQFGSTTEAMVMTGMTIAFAVGYAFDYVSDTAGWINTFRVAYILAFFMGFISQIVPESPTWLIHQGKDKTEILESLRTIYPEADLDSVTELSNIVENETKRKYDFEHTKESDEQLRSYNWFYRSGLYDYLIRELQITVIDKTLFRAASIKVTVNILKIITGQTAILYYGTTIFGHLFSSSKEADDLLLAYIGGRALVAIGMTQFADMFGRRTYLIGSNTLMFVSLLIAAVGFYEGWSIVTTVALFGSGLGFEIGFGSISYFLLSEIVPYNIRSSSNAVANWTLFLAYFIITFVFPSLLDGPGYFYTFLFFALASVYSVYYVYSYIPETKDVHAEEAYKLVDEKFESAPPGVCCCDNWPPGDASTEPLMS